MNRNGSVFINNACGRCKTHVEDAIMHGTDESMQIYMDPNTQVLHHEKHECNRHRKYTSEIAATFFPVSTSQAQPWAVCDIDIFKVSCLYVPAFLTCAVFCSERFALGNEKLS